MKKFGGPGRKKRCCIKRQCNSHESNSNSKVVADKISPVSDARRTDEHRHLLEQGRKAHRVKGDGNCMFRSIAYSISNDDDNHGRVRLLLQRFENLNKGVFKKVLTTVNKPTFDEHVAHIGKPNVWGTHIELFATATFFQVPVYTYKVDDSLDTPKWEIFRPLLEAKSLRFPVTVDHDLCSQTPSHIELLYYSDCHYDSIIDCSTDRPCNTQPQLKSGEDKSVIEILT